MKHKYFLVLIIVLCVAVSFVSIGKIKNKSAKTDTVSVINGNSVESGNQAIDENSAAELNEIASISRSGTQETKTLADGSEYSAVYNRFGSITETRTFASHPRLSYVILNTTSDGKQQVYVYAQSGTVKTLPESMLAKITTASADEIANAAGIPMIIRQNAPQPDLVQMNTQPTTSMPTIQMRPSNEFSAQTQTSEPVSAAAEPSAEVKSTNDSSEKTTAVQEDAKPKDRKETITLNRQPEEK